MEQSQLIILLLWVLCSNLAGSSCQFSFFTKLHENKLVVDFTTDFQVTSRVRCAGLCNQNNDCTAFGYHAVRKECYLYHRLLLNCDLVTNDTGMYTYIKNKSDNRNVALGKPTAQSSRHNGYYSCLAVDGNFDTFSHTTLQPLAWLCVDLLQIHSFSHLTIYNRHNPLDVDVQRRIRGFEIKLSSTGGCDTAGYNSATLCYKDPNTAHSIYNITDCNQLPIAAFASRSVFLSVTNDGNNYLHVKEIQIASL